MTSCIVLDLPWKEIEKWHGSICKACDKSLRECEVLFGDRPPDEVLAQLLQDPNNCRYLGRPDPLALTIPQEPDEFYKGERRLWGRRADYYIRAMVTGYRDRSKLENTSFVDETIRKLSGVLEGLGAAFPSLMASDEDLSQALQSHPKLVEVLTRFFVSNIDPILYSCLTYLQKLDRYREKQTYESLRAILIDYIQRELERFLDPLDTASTQRPYSDESTVWWGISALIRRQGELFEVGQEKGYLGAARLCRRLIGDPARGLISPHDDPKRWAEATWEVCNHVRTRLFVLLNCVNIAEDMPSDVDSELNNMLSQVVSENFRKVRGATSIRSHFYFLGVALQVSCRLMEYLDSIAASAATRTADQAWFSPDGLPPAYFLSDDKLIVDSDRLDLSDNEALVLKHLVIREHVDGPRLKEVALAEGLGEASAKRLDKVFTGLIKRHSILESYIVRSRKRGRDYETKVENWTMLLKCPNCSVVLPLRGDRPEMRWWQCNECSTKLKGSFVDNAPECSFVKNALPVDNLPADPSDE